MTVENGTPKTPNIRCEQFESKNGFVCGGLSLMGTDHTKKSLPCQDYCGFEIDEKSGYGVFAVSDGHGSVKLSEYGSNIAVDTVKSIIKNCKQEKYTDTDIIRYLMRDEGKRSIVGMWTDGVLRHWDENRHLFPELSLVLDSKDKVIDQYGATLLFIVVLKKYIVACTVGDGALILINHSKTDVESVLDDEEDIGESTLSLSHQRADYIQARLFSRKDFGYAIISTDGIGKPYKHIIEDIAKDCANSIDGDFDAFKKDMIEFMMQANPQIGDDISLMVIKF